MPHIQPFDLPLTDGAPPDGFGWDGRQESELSTKTGFRNGIDQRDTFLGERLCIVCGVEWMVHCHIIPQAQHEEPVVS